MDRIGVDREQKNVRETNPETLSFELAKTLYDRAVSKHLTLATAESLTCGMIAARIGDVPGISKVYRGGFVTYCDEMKSALIGVNEETLREHGAISKETAEEMCLGAALRAGTDLAVSATGNAGPDAQEGKPVGLVYIGVSCHGKAYVKEYCFKGDRSEIRRQSVLAALSDLAEVVDHYAEA